MCRAGLFRSPFFVPLCNGSTRDFGSLSPRSNRGGTTMFQKLILTIVVVISMTLACTRPSTDSRVVLRDRIILEPLMSDLKDLGDTLNVRWYTTYLEFDSIGNIKIVLNVLQRNDTVWKSRHDLLSGKTSRHFLVQPWRWSDLDMMRYRGLLAKSIDVPVGTRYCILHKQLGQKYWLNPELLCFTDSGPSAWIDIVTGRKDSVNPVFRGTRNPASRDTIVPLEVVLR